MFRSESPIVVDENQIGYLTNLDIPARSPSFSFMAALIAAGCLSSGLRFMNGGEFNDTSLGFQVLCCALVVCAWLARKFLSPRPHNILSPDSIFVTFFCVFHFSYITLYSLGWAPWDDETFWAPDKVLPAINYCLWCLIVFLVGYEVVGRRYSRYEPNPMIEPIPHGLLFISKITILVGAVFFFGAILSMGLSRVLSDYKTMLLVGVASPMGRLFWLGQNICLTGVALYCTASGMLNRKHMAGFFMIIVWFYILSILMLGDRGGFIQLFIMPLMAFHYFQKKIKIKWLLALAFLVFSWMAVVGVARQAAFGNVVRMYQEYKSTEQAQVYNPVVYSLIEFGTSVKTVVIAMDLVPEKYAYWNGRSYLDALTLLIPNIIPGMIRTSQGVVAWLTETAFGSLLFTHGRGGSMAMEAYVNFGFWGGVFSFGLLGCFSRSLYERFLIRPTFLRIAFLFGVMAGYSLWMRNSFSMFVRPAIWTFLTAYVFQMIFRTQTTENRESNPSLPSEGHE